MIRPHALVAFVPTALTCVCLGQTSQRFDVRYYETDAFEAHFQNPMPTGNQDVGNFRQVALSIDLTSGPQGGPLAAGEILFVTTEVLARQGNPQGSVGGISIGGGIYLGRRPCYCDGGITPPYCDDTSTPSCAGELDDGFEITERHGQNLNRPVGLIDETYIKAGTFRVPEEGIPPERHFVNLYVIAKSTQTQNQASLLDEHCRMTVIRFKPVSAPNHGWQSYSPQAANTVLSPTVGSTPVKIYELNLDDPDENPNTSDGIDLKVNDVILALGEFEATYTSTTPIYVHSQVLLGSV